MSPANMQMKCIELQSDVQFKEKFIQVSLLDFHKFHLPKMEEIQKYIFLINILFHYKNLISW